MLVSVCVYLCVCVCSQLYNNVQCTGNCGFMLLDQNGMKLPLYNLHVQYTAAARQWVQTYRVGGMPLPYIHASMHSTPA